MAEEVGCDGGRHIAEAVNSKPRPRNDLVRLQLVHFLGCAAATVLELEAELTQLVRGVGAGPAAQCETASGAAASGAFFVPALRFGLMVDSRSAISRGQRLLSSRSTPRATFLELSIDSACAAASSARLEA